MHILRVLLAISILPSWLFVFAAPADDAASDAYSRGTSLGHMEAKYRKYVKDTLAGRDPQARCNSKNVLIRKEWGSMTKQERIDYTKAVKCLYSQKPPLSSPQDVPGARNRFDDFVAAHVKETYKIHINGYFYGWHRHFVWLYEQALRNECGYQGPTPYWDWTRNADDPRKSPVFDGSETSLGGNGESIPHGPVVQTGFGIFEVLPGTGGGCVKDGPFADITVNLGKNLIVLPVGQNLSTTSQNITRIPNENETALAYNPRCLIRDINLEYSRFASRSDVEFLLSCPNALCLLQRGDGWEPTNTNPQNGQNRPGPHTAGHFAIGGLQNDPFASPGDPVFYLHHAQLDRVWAIWQAQNPETRTYEIGGPKNALNIPPSDSVQADDPLDFGVTGNAIRLREAGSTIDGPYCYIYE